MRVNILYILNIILYTILSWVLIHVLAVFGVFISFAFPIWWLIAPKATICFLCRSKEEGELCKLCNRIVDKKGGIYPSPKNLRSAILNGLIIMVFSIISMGLVFAEGRLLYKIGFPPTPKTVSFVIPSKGQYRLGEIFPMKIEVAGVKVPINAVQADIGFDPSKLEVEDVSTSDSFANIFIQKEIKNEVGYTRLTGGLPNPGFFSDRGTFGTVYFKGIEPGVVKIEFLPTSMVLANDGKGTNVLKEFPSVSYLILPEKITKDEEEMQKKLISLGPAVLGESEKSTQIEFFDEGSVLGKNTENEIKGASNIKKFDPLKFLSSILESIDTFVVNLWTKVFEVVTGKSLSTTTNQNINIRENK